MIAGHLLSMLTLVASLALAADAARADGSTTPRKPDRGYYTDGYDPGYLTGGAKIDTPTKKGRSLSWGGGSPASSMASTSNDNKRVDYWGGGSEPTVTYTGGGRTSPSDTNTIGFDWDTYNFKPAGAPTHEYNITDSGPYWSFGRVAYDGSTTAKPEYEAIVGEPTWSFDKSPNTSNPGTAGTHSFVAPSLIRVISNLTILAPSNARYLAIFSIVVLLAFAGLNWAELVKHVRDCAETARLVCEEGAEDIPGKYRSALRRTWDIYGIAALVFVILFSGAPAEWLKYICRTA